MAKRRSRFERQVIRSRNRTEKQGQRIMFNAIKAQYASISELIGTMSPQSLLEIPISSAPVQLAFDKYYPMFADIGVMYRKNALSQKTEAEDLFYNNTFEERLLHFARTEAGARVSSITATSEKFIRGAIESAITQTAEEGLSVDAAAKLIRSNLVDSLGTIAKSRAKTIAQTEMIIGSNRASEDAIQSTGLQYRKFWSNSGLANIRDSHIFAQDNFPNGIAKDELFDMGNGNFMMFVGDPSGQPEEIINCRCTTLYEVI